MVRYHVTIAALGMAAASLTFDAAKADPYPWCADYTVLGGIGARNCYFMTFEQCRATVSGVGGMCVRNLFYDGSPVGSTPTPQIRRSKRKS
jgi:hypothetical protein